MTKVYQEFGWPKICNPKFSLKLSIKLKVTYFLNQNVMTKWKGAFKKESWLLVVASMKNTKKVFSYLLDSKWQVNVNKGKKYFILQQNLLDLINLSSKSLKSFVIVGLMSEQSLLVAEGA